MHRLQSALFALIAALAGCASNPARHDHAVDFPISCGPDAQADFDRALVLLHHMTYPQARAAFRRIADAHPECAIAEWGVAMTLFTPLWPTRPSVQDIHLGWDILQRAQATGQPTPRERAYLSAVGEFFRDPDSADYAQRIARWETAMASLHAAYPQDQEATAFYALALLASSRPGPTAQQHSRAAAELLVPILERNPRHPGAMHYLIHANDASGREQQNLDVVHEYEHVAPDNPHALHMPTHIYTRLGDWNGVTRGNLRAAEAALKFPAGEHGEFVWDEFPHAIEYLVYAYLQQGDDDDAAAQIARLVATSDLEPTTKTTFHLASTRARYALERKAWTEAAALVPREPAAMPWDRFPWAEAVTWFARGYGAARLADLAEARRASGHLVELEARADASGEDVFARQIRMLRLALESWTAHAAQDDTAALALMQQAVDLEVSTPKPSVTPAPTLPTPELLGELLLELGRPNEALAAYRQSLQRYPRRFNGTLGLARALAMAGDNAGAAGAYCELLRIAPNSKRAAISEARRFVDGHATTPRMCEPESAVTSAQAQ